MSEILDNQEITTETLNNIAIDLGIPEFNGFGETKFGVAALNNITRDLTGKGILAIDNECKLTLVENTLSIATGVIIFDSGAKLRLSSPISVEVDSTQKAYVYAVNDTVNNKIVLNVAYEPMTVGDFFLLCEIENGTLYDKRTFSRSKVTPLGNLQMQKATVFGGLDASAEGLIGSVELENMAPTIVIFRQYSSDFDSNGVGSIYGKWHVPFFIYFVAEDKYLTIEPTNDYDLIFRNINNSAETYPIKGSEEVSIRVAVEGGKLNVYGKNAYTMYRSTVSYDVEIM